MSELRLLVEGLLGEHQTAARARHVALEALVFADAVAVDLGSLRGPLGGLVEGAVKRAPAGTNVTVVVSPRGRHIEFRVADEGPGIVGAIAPPTAGAQSGEPRSQIAALASCQQFANENGGRFSVAESDAGTVICLALPGAERAAIPAQSPEEAAAVPTRGPRHQSGTHARVAAPLGDAPTVLVVDDEPLVRDVAARLLQMAGFRTLTADSAERALSTLTQYSDISLLLSDVGLPGASGAELVRRARVLAPNVPALLMSATSKDSLVRDGVLEPETFLLQKPFAGAELLTKVRELLPSSPEGASSKSSALG